MNERLIANVASDLSEAIQAIQQPRSDFQLAAFVVGQHDTQPRRWMQCVLELQIKLQNLKRAAIQRRQMDRKLKSLGNCDEAELLRLDIEDHELAILGAIRETECLYSIFKSFDRTYTREELDAAEAEYWQKRLTRQAKHSLIATGRIGVGDLDSFEQIGQPVTLETIHKMESELTDAGRITTN